MMRRTLTVVMIIAALASSGCHFVGVLDHYQPPSAQEQQFRTHAHEFMSRGGYVDQYAGGVAITAPTGNTRYISPRR